MFRKSTLYVLVGVLIVAAMLLSACGETPTVAPEATEKAPAAELSVGVVLPTKNEPRWIQDETRFNDAFAAAGYDVQILFSDGDSAKERSNVQSLISQGVQVIVICPHDATAAAAAAAEAREAGVKVVSYDRLIRDTDAVDYYVTFDSVSVGEAQGQYLIDKASGTGNPLYLYAGAATDNNAFLFFEGAWNVLQPKIADGTFVIKNSSEAEALQDKATLTRDEMGQIIGQITTDWLFDVAKNLAEAHLTATTAADKGDVFILAPNDGTARAIADVFAADADVTSYVVTGQDAEIPSVQYIIDGKQSMTVLKDVRTLVSDAIAAAIAYLEGGAPEETATYNNGVIDVPAKPSVVVTVDQSNVVEALIDSGYYEASEFTGLPGGAAPPAEFAVGVVLPTKNEPRWIQDETRFKDAFAAAGYDVQILFSDGDSAKERSNVEALINQGVQVIVICPHDATAAAAAAAEAREAGIKVISYDRLIRDTDAVDYYVTFDSVSVGEAQGQYLIDKASGTGNPLYLYAGAATDNNAFLFFEGAWNVLQPKIADGTFVIKNSSQAEALQDKATLTRDEMGQIIGQITTDWLFDVAKNLAEANLTATTAADKGDVFILAPNDGTARAIADVFAADADVTSYVVTGQDAEIPSVQYIIDGKQSMTVLKDVRTLVSDAIAAAIAYLTGGTPEETATYNNGVIDVPAKPSLVVSVDQTNVREALIDSGYYDEGEFTWPEFAVGVVLPTKNEPRWIQDETRFNDAFAAAGYDVQILFSDGDSAKERANVQALISQGVQVIVICPHDATAAAAAAAEAREAGIKVISYDRLIRDTDAVDYYVTFDSVSVGEAQGQYLIDNATGTGNPLYLYAGAATDNNAFLFFEGAWNVLQPKIADGTFVIKNSSQAEALQDNATLTRDEMGQIIGQVTTDWLFDVAKNLAEANLTATTAADKGDVFILAPNDGTARAIADVFAADADVTSYVVTGQDAEIPSVQYIIDGKQSMTVLKDVRTLVSDAIAAAIAYLTGGTPEETATYNNGVIDVPAKPSVVVTVDQSNVVEALIDSGYYEASEFTGLP